MKRPLTNKLLILNSVLLGIILSVLLILNFDVLMLKFGLNTGDPDDDTEFYDEGGYFPVQDSLKACFEGLRNDDLTVPDEITAIIEAKLNGFNWNNEFQAEDLHSMDHQTIFKQEFPADHGPFRKWIILTFSNFGNNYSHASCGRVSLFEFQKEGENWRLTRNFMAFGNGDEYGFEPNGCEIVRIGRNNKYAAIIHTSYSGQRGHQMEVKSVYMEVDGAFESVFDFTIYETYDEYVPSFEFLEGYSEMRIIESNKAYFDIVTKGEETDWEDITFGAVRHFVFNGEFYVENPCWLYTDVPIPAKDE